MDIDTNIAHNIVIEYYPIKMLENSIATMKNKIIDKKDNHMQCLVPPN